MFTKDISRVDIPGNMVELENLGCNCLTYTMERQSCVPLVENGMWLMLGDVRTACVGSQWRPATQRFDRRLVWSSGCCDRVSWLKSYGSWVIVVCRKHEKRGCCSQYRNFAVLKLHTREKRQQQQQQHHHFLSIIWVTCYCYCLSCSWLVNLKLWKWLEYCLKGILVDC